MVVKGSYIIEPVINNHRDLQELNPNSLNTIRVISVFDSGNCVIISAALRMGNGKRTDNVSAGGLIAPINIKDGLVYKPAISGDPTCIKQYPSHPITGTSIVGLYIPFWDELLAMIQKMAKILSSIKSIGWDIAITPTGPVLVEMNNHWNVHGLQKSSGDGILPKLAPYIPKSVLYPAHRKLLKTNR